MACKIYVFSDIVQRKFSFHLRFKDICRDLHLLRLKLVHFRIIILTLVLEELYFVWLFIRKPLFAGTKPYLFIFLLFMYLFHLIFDIALILVKNSIMKSSFLPLIILWLTKPYGLLICIRIYLKLRISRVYWTLRLDYFSLKLEPLHCYSKFLYLSLFFYFDSWRVIIVWARPRSGIFYVLNWFLQNVLWASSWQTIIFYHWLL